MQTHKHTLISREVPSSCSVTYTQTHTPVWALWRQWRLRCYHQLHHAVSALHHLTAVPLQYLWVGVCVCYNRRERGWGLSRKPGQLHCVCQLQVSRSLCVALHVCDPQRGFPLHWVSTSLCLWPSSVCHSVSTSTLTLQLSGMFSAHRVTIAALNVFLQDAHWAILDL